MSKEEKELSFQNYLFKHGFCSNIVDENGNMLCNKDDTSCNNCNINQFMELINKDYNLWKKKKK